MIYTSPIFAQASGSIGHIVFSHNAGGPYVRHRTKPAKPPTPAQHNIEGLLQFNASCWANQLNDAQRQAWSLYAAHTPVVNALGQPIHLNGYCMWQRCRMARLCDTPTGVVDAPTINTHAPLVSPSFTLDSNTARMKVYFDETDEWTGGDPNLLMVYCSRGMPASINYYKGPFLFNRHIHWDWGAPLTSPQTLTYPFEIDGGWRYFCRFRACLYDGRVSNPTIATAVATAIWP